MKTGRLILMGLVLILPLWTVVSIRAMGIFTKGEKKIPCIGILGYGGNQSWIETFRQGMGEFGYTEGIDYRIEYEASEGKVSGLPARVNELLRRGVDIILSSGTSSTLAALKESKNIPIVMVNIGADPVSVGLVKSLSHPGGNVTGLAAIGAELWGKRLQFFREILPKCNSFAFLYNSSNPGNIQSMNEFRLVADKAGMRVRLFITRDSQEIEEAFQQIRQEHYDALACAWDPFLMKQARKIADFAILQKLPTIMPIQGYVEGGALISYGAKISAQWMRVAWYIDRILKGAHPSELPVEQPMTFELVINQKTAKALGVKIPPAILMQADRVIE